MSKAVFKFCSGAGAIAILQHNSIFITSPLDLNDPFEMRPAWTDEHATSHQQDEQRRSELMHGMPVFIAQSGDKLARGPTMPYIPPQPQIPVESQMGISDMHNQPVFSKFHDEFRVLSLVARLFNLHGQDGESNERATLMWAHYADQFQGICIALDPDRFNNGLRPGGFKVRYPKQRKSLPPNWYDTFLAPGAEGSSPPGYSEDPGSKLLLPAGVQAEVEKERFIELLTHKSPAWSYEREIRMIYDIRQQRKAPDYRRIKRVCQTCKEKGFSPETCENPSYRDAISIPPEAVLAVIFGTDCLPGTVKKLFSILQAPGYSNVETYWSALHSSRYAVQYVKADRDYIESIQAHRANQIAYAKKHVRSDAKGQQLVLAPKGINYDLRGIKP